MTACVALLDNDSGRRRKTATTAATPRAPKISSPLVLRMLVQKTAIGDAAMTTPRRARRPSHRTRCHTANQRSRAVSTRMTARPSMIAWGGVDAALAARPTGR